MEGGEGKSFVAFIDILGFKEMVDEYYTGKNNAILLILKDTLNKAEEKIKESSDMLNLTSIKPRFKQFSDSVSLSMPLAYDTFFLPQLLVFVNLIGTYQKILMENKIFCRGGIAFEYHYENENLIFSKGLIKAFNNESEIAIYPRIIIDKELMKSIKDEWKFISTGVPGFANLLCPLIIQDWDELYFINPFYYFAYMAAHPNTDGFTEKGIETRKQFIEEHNISYKNILNEVEINIIKFENDYTIKRKYIWLREFLVWLNEPALSKIAFSRME